MSMSSKTSIALTLISLCQVSSKSTITDCPAMSFCEFLHCTAASLTRAVIGAWCSLLVTSVLDRHRHVVPIIRENFGGKSSFHAMEKYYEEVESWIMDEGTPVTYRWLSTELSIPVMDAKLLLYSFAQKKGDEVSSTYLVSGRDAATHTHQVMVVAQEKLEETKQGMDVVISEHIYSVARKDMAGDSLLEELHAKDQAQARSCLDGSADESKAQAFIGNTLSGITNSTTVGITFAAKGTRPPPPPLAPFPTFAPSAASSSSSSSSSSAKGGKSKSGKAGNKKQVASAMQFFKASSTNAKAKSASKSDDTAASVRSSDTASSSDVNSEHTSTSSKSSSKSKSSSSSSKKKRRVLDSDDEAEEEDEGEGGDGVEDEKTDKQAPVEEMEVEVGEDGEQEYLSDGEKEEIRKHGRPKKKKHAPAVGEKEGSSDEKENEVKKGADEEGEAEEQPKDERYVDEPEKRKRKKKQNHLPADAPPNPFFKSFRETGESEAAAAAAEAVGSNSSSEEGEGAKQKRRRVTKRVLTKKQSVDAKGYLVTEDVWEEVEVEEEEPQPEVEAAAAVADEKQPLKQVQLGGNSSGNSNKKNSGNNKKKVPVKGAKPKQRSMMSFFAKKA